MWLECKDRRRSRRLAASIAAVVLIAGLWSSRPSAEDGGSPEAAGEAASKAVAVLEAGDEEAFEAAYEAGQAARKAAARLGFEWRDTRRMLRRARKLAEKGEYEKAIKLANRARRQGELGVLQAKEQAEAWKELVVKPNPDAL